LIHAPSYAGRKLNSRLKDLGLRSSNRDDRTKVEVDDATDEHQTLEWLHRKQYFLRVRMFKFTSASESYPWSPCSYWLLEP